MDIQRQRYSKFNTGFRQQQQRINTVHRQPIQRSVIYPVNLPTSRPQPRRQARPKHHPEPHLPLTQTTQRATTAHVKHQQPLPRFNQQFMTLTNVTKILRILQERSKMSDTETSTDMSTSTTHSARQRLQQHLQETATRWWKPIRSSNNQLSAPVPSSINLNEISATPTQVLPSNLVQQREEPDKLPLITIVSNSTRQWNLPLINDNGPFHTDESESSTEIQTTTILSSVVQHPKITSHTKHIRQEPLIMQPRGMRLRPYDNPYYYTKQNDMNFLQRQSLIHQT